MNVPQGDMDVVQSGSTLRSPLPRESHPFLVVRENQLAYQTAMRLKARHPRMTSPIVTLIGPRGSGKSHLARQLCREVYEEHSATSVLRTSAAEFTGKFQRAARESQIRSFQKQHRENVDLLIFEDLQELQTRPEVQQQLLAMLEDIVSAGARVLLTSRTSPGEIKGFLRRLTNRCQGGILVELPNPGEASRRKLIEHFAGALNLVLPESTLKSLAQRGSTTPGDLMEAVRRLRSAPPKVLMSPDELDVIEPPRANFTVHEIARRVARHFGIRLLDLKSASRQSSLVTARHLAMYLSREMSHSHFAEIGEYFGGRNHASVMYACQRIEELKDSNLALRADLESLRSEIEAR